MRRPTLILLGLVALAAAGVVLSAQGPTIVGKVNFAFTAANANLPAGAYTFEKDSPVLIHVHDLNLKGTPQALVSVITRIAAVPNMPARVVFDHVGDKYVLSEVWIPGEDGFLVSMAATAHTHEVVSGK